MKQSNLANLVDDAFYHGDAQASGYRWTAKRHPMSVIITHHSTPMFKVWFSNVGGINAHSVEAIDRGYGSMSDRCGVRRITEGAGVGIGYKELYDEE
tara:strand:+ start:475 stop:765 length:291 start_codon:yes stop_codon:yes gene_type:complete